MYAVRQAHHERKKVNIFNTNTVRPEPVEGQLSGVLQVPPFYEPGQPQGIAPTL